MFLPLFKIYLTYISIKWFKSPFIFNYEKEKFVEINKKSPVISNIGLDNHIKWTFNDIEVLLIFL